MKERKKGKKMKQNKKKEEEREGGKGEGMEKNKTSAILFSAWQKTCGKVLEACEQQ